MIMNILFYIIWLVFLIAIPLSSDSFTLFECVLLDLIVLIGFMISNRFLDDKLKEKKK